MIIDSPTVFVLGAGASAHLDYPVGYELKKAICSNNSDEIFMKSDFTGHEIGRFINYFAECPEVSIDRFLKVNPECGSLGKMLIAASLFPCESEGRLSHMENQEDWYAYFWNMIDHSFENIDKHNMHFITFNYDRSLEQFLFSALYKYYLGKKTDKEIAEKICNIDIVHVYGCLSPLPWQSRLGGSKAYSPNYDKRALDLAVRNILLIGEERDGETFEERKSKIQTLISKAEYIYFLGFGFDEDNLGIIGKKFDNAVEICGTTYGLGGRKEYEVMRWFQGASYKQTNNFREIRLDASEVVRLYPKTIKKYLHDEFRLHNNILF